MSDICLVGEVSDNLVAKEKNQQHEAVLRYVSSMQYASTISIKCNEIKECTTVSTEDNEMHWNMLLNNNAVIGAV
ncbi:hypothetical protein CEXT_294431 [Caerostris extrusa]|uniref:Uncharacterized protein n=1 Tax=Caerostris extrusa TaxID=172846 RepID=A0AAV4URW8_CAEEX|nr:hypothetical protein CEXT_294431 [Caerostris extrusa]